MGYLSKLATKLSKDFGFSLPRNSLVVGGVTSLVLGIAVVLAFAVRSDAFHLDEARKVVLVGGICSVNPAQSMEEIYEWLTKDLGYQADDVLLFDYRDATPLASFFDTYRQQDTLISIDGAGGSSEFLRQMLDSLASEGEQYDVIAHSQGGLVALYASLDLPGQAGPPISDKIHSIVTINSPVQGIDAEHLAVATIGDLFGVFCADANDPSVLDMFESPDGNNDVIGSIKSRVWSNQANPYIINVSNTQDPVVSRLLSLGGTRGVLGSAHEFVREDLGGNSLTAHTMTLNVLSNGSAGPLVRMLMRGLIEYQLTSLFISVDIRLDQILSTDGPGIEPQLRLTHAFMGNHDDWMQAAIEHIPIEPRPIVDVLIASRDAQIRPSLSPPGGKVVRAVRGDLNCDGAVNIIDAVVLLQYIVGRSTISRCDGI